MNQSRPTTPMSGIYRDVVKAVDSWHGRNGSLRLTLSCGHVQRRKFSQGRPAKARCKACEDVRAGGESTYFDTTSNTRHWQVWDSSKGLPVGRSAPMTNEEIAEWTR